MNPNPNTESSLISELRLRCLVIQATSWWLSAAWTSPVPRPRLRWSGWPWGTCRDACGTCPTFPSRFGAPRLLSCRVGVTAFVLQRKIKVENYRTRITKKLRFRHSLGRELKKKLSQHQDEMQTFQECPGIILRSFARHGLRLPSLLIFNSGGSFLGSQTARHGSFSDFPENEKEPIRH